MENKFDVDELIENKFRDVKLERTVLAYFLRRNHVQCTSLFQDAFTIEIFKDIFSIIKEKNIKLFPRDIFTKLLFDRISPDKRDIAKEYISKIYKTELKSLNKNTIKLLIDDLKFAYESRIILTNISEIVSSVDNFDLQKTKKLLRESLLVNVAYDQYSSGDFLEDYHEREKYIRRMQENPNLIGVKTGIKKFDNISGGIQKGELGILIAPTGKGKSMALGNFGLNAWLDYKNILFISLEMTKIQLQLRLDSRIALIQHSKFRQAQLTETDFKKWKISIQKLKSQMQNFYEIICMPRGATAKQIEEEAVKIQAKRGKKIDLILIDYLNLMSPNNSRGSSIEWSNQAEIAYELKSISTGFNSEGIPIWSANQMTDDYNPSKQIKTKHVKYSRGISEVAQIILGLSQTVDQYLEDNRMSLEIVKCRDFAPLEKPIEIYPNLEMMILNEESSTIEDFGN